MPAFPAYGLKPYYDALKAWLTTSLNEDGTLRESALPANVATVNTPGAEGEVLTVVSGVPDWAPPGSGYTDEQVRDVMGTALVAGSNVTITPNDGANTITIDAAGGGVDYGLFDVTTYGAVGDNTTNSTTAIQNAINAAFAVGGTVFFPVGQYVVTSALTIPANTAGTIRFLGDGRPRTFTAGYSGDVSSGGAEIRTTSTTASVFHFVNSPTGHSRVHVTFENLTVVGNKASGTTGHGIHLESIGTLCAIIPAYRDVSVLNCKGNGIFHDGSVFEGQMFNVRSSINGGDGFHSATRGAGIAGEMGLFGCSFFGNDGWGIYLYDTGHYSLHRVSSTENDLGALRAHAVILGAFDFQAENNGGTTTDQVVVYNCHSPQFHNLLITPPAGSTAAGIHYTGDTSQDAIYGMMGGSALAGAGYMDVKWDNTTNWGSVHDYRPTDFVDKIDFGVGVHHVQYRGGQPHAGLTKFKGCVVHGAVAGTARPGGYASIEWIGSVEPTNMEDGDTWVVTS